MRVPFCELRRGYIAHREELDAAYRTVMERGYFIMGSELENFEKEFALYCGAKHALGVSDGLNALVLILRALGVGYGDEVIVSAHTFVASWLAITQCGAVPVPVTPGPGSFQLDEHAIEKLITSKTKAIMPVHLYGQAANMTVLEAVAAKYNIPILEDAAQAHGAKHKDRMCGSFGSAAGFSFYPAKNLGAFGDGGAITTNDTTLYEKVRLLRNYGSHTKYVHEVAGINSRLDEMQAAFLRVKLRHLDAWNAKRNKTAALYTEAFKDLDFLETPKIDKNDFHVWHQYVVTTPYRDALQEHLNSAGVGTMIHYPIPNHQQGAYAEQDFSAYDFESYEKLVGGILSLPIDTFITSAEIQFVIDTIRRYRKS